MFQTSANNNNNSYNNELISRGSYAWRSVDILYLFLRRY